MSGSTSRIEVKQTSNKAWTLLASGPKNVVIKVLKDCQLVEIIYQTTATPDPTLDQYFPLEWDDVALSISLETGASIYYRIESGHHSWMSVLLQDA